jgi:hypothetical protein
LAETKRINERTAYPVPVSFFSSGSPAAPTTIHYRLETDDGTEVIDDTSVSAASQVTITLPPSAHVIAAAGQAATDPGPGEYRNLLVVADKGLATQRVARHRYWVDWLNAETDWVE